MMQVKHYGNKGSGKFDLNHTKFKPYKTNASSRWENDAYRQNMAINVPKGRLACANYS
jgi:hypothetical protein